MTAPRVYTVPPGRPFLDAVARAIMAGDLPVVGGAEPTPLDLPAVTLILPTRRASRAVQEAFLRIGEGRALMLPRIRPIAEGEEDLSLLAGLAGLDGVLPGSGDVPAAVSELERQLALTQLVMAWSRTLRRPVDDEAPFAAAGAATLAQAARLAAELASLMDEVEREGVSLDKLDSLVDAGHAEHWRHTLEFLQILVAHWPAYLAERKLLSPADRRNRLILAEAQLLKATPPKGPVIVAGVTGSIPATAELIRTVAALPNGAVVLPGLDRGLDEAGWRAVRGARSARGDVEIPGHPEHPQYGLAGLVGSLGIGREDVVDLPGATHPGPRIGWRQRLVSEALRPAATTDRWQDFIATTKPDDIRAALDGVDVIEAESADEEAEVVALILREAIEVPGRTAALVSPDRRLARRVVTRLETWGIEVDDSAGRPFAKTPLGTLLDLSSACAQHDYRPADVLALLKHPLVRLGFSAREVGFATRALEIAAFRTLYLGSGLDGIVHALDRARVEAEDKRRRDRAVRTLRPADWDRAHLLATRLVEAFAPVEPVRRSGAAHPLGTLVKAHVAAAEALGARPADENADGSLWRGEAGEAGTVLFAGLLDETLPVVPLTWREYPDFFRGLVSGLNVRPRAPLHPRLSIWGPFESRLQQPDIVVLGSLNEGTWPEAADPGPWLNRAMRERLGLPSPEERIGHAAHDVSGLLGARVVHITRARKVDGTPTVASRWLLRLRALLAGAGCEDALAANQNWLGWARHRHRVEATPAARAPAPRPPLALRPRSLSVSDVETWIANPYAIYARHILGLEPLSDVGASPDAAMRGAVVHEALSRFAAEFPDRLPNDIASALVGHARHILDELDSDPRVAAFWVPRLERFADWFAETEGPRRAGVARTLAELKGETTLEGLPGGPFRLRTRADRIDELGSDLVITDYKTGTPPKSGDVVSGVSPQLPLEAAIAMRGGFEGLGPGCRRVAGLRYIRASGGEPAGEQTDIKADDVGALADATLKDLARLVERFDDERTPYRAVRRARFRYDFDAYAHLARVAEWAGGEDAGEEGGT